MYLKVMLNAFDCMYITDYVNDIHTLYVKNWDTFQSAIFWLIQAKQQHEIHNGICVCVVHPYV